MQDVICGTVNSVIMEIHLFSMLKRQILTTKIIIINGSVLESEALLLQSYGHYVVFKIKSILKECLKEKKFVVLFSPGKQPAEL